MKSISAALLFVFCSLNAFSQSIQFPTNGQLYDFAVGDSFVYNNGGQITSVTTISRSDYGNDSIIYIERFLNRGDSTPFLNKRTITNVNSPYYYRPGAAEWINYSIINSDTFYTLNYQGRNCGVDGIAYTDYYTIYHVGLGDVYDGFQGEGMDQYGNIIYCGSYICLIYAHKESGATYGNSSDCYYTGPTSNAYAGSTAIDTIIVASVINIKNSALKLFPNPTSASFQIQISSPPAEETNFQLFDALGRLIKQQTITAITTTINRGNLTNGIYFWQLEANGQILNRGKIVFE